MYLNKDFDTYLKETSEIGFVEMLQYPLVLVSGLPSAFLGEVLLFEDNTLGMVFSLKRSQVYVLLLGPAEMSVGIRAVRTGMPLEIPVYSNLLGGAFTPLGETITSNVSPGEILNSLPVFSTAPDFSARARIEEPLDTGVSIVDLMIPLGKGQRELVIGDRKSGKTEFLLQVALTQIASGSICIYASIGKTRSDILDILDFQSLDSVRDSFLLVGSNASAPLGEIFITPYVAMAYAEYFRNRGKDVLLILDDLTTHASFYREMSLISGSFPGRGSYPGDIFTVHSQLLERAGNFRLPDGSTHSITCLPVADTIEGDISGYIQTNLMSMTDGHLYFDSALFDAGHRPAVNTFLSVTRVGRQVQSTLHKSLNRELVGFMNLRRKHERFVHFGAELSEGIKTSLEMGRKLDAFFNQHPRFVYPRNVQYLLSTMLWSGLIDIKQVTSIRFFGEKLVKAYNTDADFRKFVDDIFDESLTFNDVLSRVMKDQTSIKSVLGSLNG